MAMSAPRSSVFTFESTVHSAHVLCRLDEQRRRDILCDVTVVVECQSFRAHRAVLASCSEYFSQRLSALAQHGAVISLPQEVTVTGFEPLLKFAYTSKLLFGKDSVLDVRNAASILGFRDLDEACFDFLLPKFFSSSKSSVACPRMTCCERKYKRHLSKAESPTDSDVVLLDEKEEKPVADSPFQQEAAQLCKKSSDGKRGSQNDRGALTPGAEGLNETFVQCPKYRKFQLACGKDACVTERSLNNLATVVRDDCNLSCSPNSSRNETEVQIPSRRSNCEADEPRETEVKEEKTEDGVAVQEVKQDKNYVVKMEEDATGVDSLDTASVEAVSLGESAVQGERSTRLILHHCPLMALARGPAITRSLEQERFVMDLKKEKKPVDCGGQGPEAWGERHKEGQTGMSEAKEVRIMERNVESAGSLNVLDSDAGSSSDTGSGQPPTASLEWLKLHVNLSSSSSGGVGSSGVDSSGGGCPFLQDLDQSKCLWKGAGQSESEGASLSGVSSPNSGEDGESETETEGDSESYARERARQVQLPFSVDWIVDLSRTDFQQLLKQQTLTREQLDFVHDMRRRSKNRLAAQRCRKRKLDCIYNLQYEINKLKTEREKLMMEKSQLRQLKMKTCHSVSALCQRVCSESNLQPEQLQVLTKSSDCPLSSLFPHIDALLSQRGLQVQPQTSRSVCSVNPDRFEASEEALSSTGRDTREGRRSLKLHTESLH